MAPVQRRDILRVCPLDARAFPVAPGFHGPVVFTTAAGVQLSGTAGAQPLFQFIDGHFLQLAAGVDTLLVKQLLCAWTDPRDPAHGKRLHEGLHLIRQDGELPIGFAPVACHLGQHLVRGNPRTGGESRLLEDLPPDGTRDIIGVSLVVTHIEISLIQRQWLDQVGISRENRADSPRFPPVDIKPDRLDDQMWAQLERLENRHGRAAAILPGNIITGGQDTPVGPSPHTDRLVRNSRIVAALDCRVETVHVDVDNLSWDAGRGTRDERHYLQKKSLVQRPSSLVPRPASLVPFK